MKNTILSAIIGSVITVLIVWAATVDTTNWTKSGSKAYLLSMPNSYITVDGEGSTWYISPKQSLSQKQWEALDNLNIEHLLLNDFPIIITE